jgi:hypothetical protein
MHRLRRTFGCIDPEQKRRHCEEAAADAAIHCPCDWIATPLRGSR